MTDKRKELIEHIEVTLFACTPDDDDFNPAEDAVYRIALNELKKPYCKPTSISAKDLTPEQMESLRNAKPSVIVAEEPDYKAMCDEMADSLCQILDDADYIKEYDNNDNPIFIDDISKKVNFCTGSVIEAKETLTKYQAMKGE